MKKFNLEERLIDFAVEVINLVETLPKNPVCKHLGSNQLLRSGTAPALNYGEAQSAESRADFIHKIKIILKELRESNICLKILGKQNYISEDQLDKVQKEVNELIAIFVKSYQTAKSNLDKEKMGK